MNLAPTCRPPVAAPAVVVSWKQDLLASVVVFLVALPLCLGIAVASGVRPMAGLLTGVIGGVVVGLLSGSPLQVSGPAAGLTVIVAGLVGPNGPGLAALGVIIVLAGLMQMAAGLARLGQWFRAVSPAVIHGMLGGIGVLLVAGQIHVLVDDQPRESGLDNLLSIPQAIVKGVVPSANTAHDNAARIGLLTLVVLLLWKPLAPRSLKHIPAALVGVAVAAFAAWLRQAGVRYVAIPEDVAQMVVFPSAATWSCLLEGPALLGAATIAVVASAETLLCASAVDRMNSHVRTRYDRELFAQGVGNVLCGLVGGLPMTGVIARSSANIEAGARTRLSAILHGVWLLLLVTLFPMVLRLIPTASLAAVLVLVGWKLFHPKAVRELSGYGWGEVVIYFVTLIGIVVTNLLTGVLLGFSLAVLKLLWSFTHLAIYTEQRDDPPRTILHIQGAATFLRLPRLAAALEEVPPGTELHVNLEKLSHIDHACLELLINWEKQHEAAGGSLVMDWDRLTARFR
jgi:MFS superfamily sulfate permease-like transporter